MHEFKAEEGFAAKKAGDNAAYPAMGRQSRTTLESGNTPMYHMFHDAERCIMCFSCEVHCKLENNLPVGPRLIRMIQVGPKVVGGRLKSQFVYLSCHHCDPAACVSACPTGAMQKRADGTFSWTRRPASGARHASRPARGDRPSTTRRRRRS
jgi:predicted molibdopterin-dependent oxidoreductase YjgC